MDIMVDICMKWSNCFKENNVFSNGQACFEHFRLQIYSIRFNLNIFSDFRELWPWQLSTNVSEIYQIFNQRDGYFFFKMIKNDGGS